MSIDRTLLLAAAVLGAALILTATGPAAARTLRNGPVGVNEGKTAPYCWTDTRTELVQTRHGPRWVTRRVRNCR